MGWVLIQTNALNSADRKQFETISQYLASCDSITSDEMDKWVENMVSCEAIPLRRAEKSHDEAVSDVAGASKPSSHCIIQYPLNERGASSVTVQSYECLAPGEYLDDAILDFYAEYLHREVLTPEQRQRTHIFSVFFYTVLTTRPARGSVHTLGLSRPQRRHERVAKWTKDVNIFEKDFLVVPINARNHWYMAIICYPSLEQPVYMDTNKPAPPKKRLSTSKSHDSKPIKQ